MTKLRVFEAFSGIGTQTMGLSRANIDHDVVAISEIDSYAIRSYEAIHGSVNNLGDISQIDTKTIPDHDLFTYSFPCQSISVAGLQHGLDPNSGTRSSLLWECQKVIDIKRPKYLLMENVKNLVGKTHKHNFDLWLEWLESKGYTNYWKVLNSKDYGVPQNRERVFVVSIFGKHEPYEFPKAKPLDKTLKDVLLQDVEDRHYLSQEQVAKLTFKLKPSTDIKQIGQLDRPNRVNASPYRVYSTDGIAPTLTTMTGGARQPFISEAEDQIKDFVIGASRGRYEKDPNDPTKTITKQHFELNQNGVSNTLTSVQKDNYVLEMPDFKIRKLTPLECWRLMGCTDEDFYKAKAVNSDTQLYKQAGNAIVVDVLAAIFDSLFN